MRPFRSVVAIAALAAAAGPASAQARLMGIDTSGNILVELDPATGATLNSLPVIGATSTVGALTYDPVADTVYLSSTGNDQLWRLDYHTGAATLIGDYSVGPEVVMHGLELDTATGRLYGHSLNASSGATFFEVSKATGVATPIAISGVSGFGSLGYVPETGRMYLAGTANSSLYTIDLSTGATALVGPFGVASQVGVGLAYDPAYGMLAVSNAGADALYRVNLSTGQATHIADLGTGNLISLVFIRRSAPPCYANCDGSTTPPVLNINDFVCFQGKYAAGDTSANCDNSTANPILNVNDFICFLGQYAIGCP
jgi:hypothetical protein